MDVRLPSKKTQTGRHSKEARGNELYPTPSCLVDALVKAEPLPTLIWEPAAGMGHLAAALVAAGHHVRAADLVDYGQTVEGSPRIEVADFLREWDSKGHSCIVTNPPFSLAERFVRHALDIHGITKIVILARLAFLEGSGRSDIIDGHLARVYPIISRPPMMHRWSQGEDGVWREWDGDKAGSAMPFAWFVFLREHRPEWGTMLRRINYK